MPHSLVFSSFESWLLIFSSQVLLGGVGEETVVLKALATLLLHPAENPSHLASEAAGQEKLFLSKTVLWVVMQYKDLWCDIICEKSAMS